MVNQIRVDSMRQLRVIETSPPSPLEANPAVVEFLHHRPPSPRLFCEYPTEGSWISKDRPIGTDDLEFPIIQIIRPVRRHLFLFQLQEPLRSSGRRCRGCTTCHDEISCSVSGWLAPTSTDPDG